jgi:hypothetical protein
MHGITETAADGETVVVQAPDLTDNVDQESYEIALGGTVLPREKASAAFDIEAKTVTVTNSSEGDWYPGQNLYVQAKRTSMLGGGDAEAGIAEVNARLAGHDTQIADLTSRVSALEASNPAAYDGRVKDSSGYFGGDGDDKPQRLRPGYPLREEEAKRYEMPTKDPMPAHGNPGAPLEPPRASTGSSGPGRGQRSQESDGSQINVNPDAPIGLAREQADDNPDAVDQGAMTPAHVGSGSLDPEKVRGKVVDPTQSSGSVTVGKGEVLDPDTPEDSNIRRDPGRAPTSAKKDNPNSNRDHDKNPAPGKPPKAEPKRAEEEEEV